MIEVFEEWSRHLEEHQPINPFYLGFGKAFDFVPHERLLWKLSGYGVRGKLFHWIRAFQCNHLQQVAVGNALSDWVPVSSGIPQGSTVLRQILFLIYIIDLPDIVAVQCNT